MFLPVTHSDDAVLEQLRLGFCFTLWSFKKKCTNDKWFSTCTMERGAGYFKRLKKFSSFFPFITDARDVEQLSKNNITHILSIHDSARPMLEVRGVGDSMLTPYFADDCYSRLGVDFLFCTIGVLRLIFLWKYLTAVVLVSSHRFCCCCYNNKKSNWQMKRQLVCQSIQHNNGIVLLI